MDERIRNLMKDRGTPELALEVDDPDLADNLLTVLNRLYDEPNVIRDGIDKCVIANLERMGEMGMALVDHVREHLPEFPFREGMGSGGDPWAHLPSLPSDVLEILQRQGVDA